MITGSLSLALCTIMFRRFMDSFNGRIPLAIQSNVAPNTTALFMLSGALYYLYSHLRKGTLVRIGQRPSRHVVQNSFYPRLTIQKRPKNNSWFLKNARACRRKCTNAMYKIAKQSYESLHNLNPCLLLPNKSFQICFTKVRSDTNLQQNREERRKDHCNIIYSNEVFHKNSNQELNYSEVKKHNLQNTVRSVEPAEIVTAKRKNSRTRQRLSLGSLKQNDSNVVHKERKISKRMTRSGKIYSRFE